MLRLIGKILFWISGWEVEGSLPANIKKCVIIIAPHTSFWDFYLGVVARAIGQFKANYLVKAELFKVPIVGWFLDLTGGIPVDRKNKSNTVVEEVVRHFQNRDRLILALTPEGTRSKVNSFKTGFYRIAQKAGVPIIMVAFDFEHKKVRYLEEFYPTGDMDNDVEYILSQYRGIKGRHPELGLD